MNGKTDKNYGTSNINILGSELLSTPEQIRSELPMSPAAEATVLRARKTLQDILDGRDHRLFAVIGPCSVHDSKAAMEYADRLAKLAKDIQKQIFVLMRVYFEKPRTTLGWKGLINDPDIDDTFQMEKGIRIGRKLLLQINELGLPAATEALDPVMPQYLSDLISWSAIGARTTESQTHREIASGLSMPVGFKNGTDGNVTMAINGMKSAQSSHHFLGMTEKGQVARFHTKGNPYGHLVLRGGSDKPNYDSKSVQKVESMLKDQGLPQRIVIDCSHGNSEKDESKQPVVMKEAVRQRIEGRTSVVGFMLESNLEAGRQDIPEDLTKLRYGVSITDSCIDWATTERALREAHQTLSTQSRKDAKESQP